MPAVLVSLAVLAAIAVAAVLFATRGSSEVTEGAAATTAPTPPVSSATSPAGSAPALAPSGPRRVPDPVTGAAAAGTSDDVAPTAGRAWPAPPTRHLAEPWNQQGFDAGRIVRARMEHGHAVLTVDRIQFYSEEQWKAKTGKTTDMDNVTVNASPRLRDFVVEDGALIFPAWQFGLSGTGTERFSARTLVERTNAEFAEQAAFYRKYPDVQPEQPSITVVLFHRGGVDGPVAYVQDAGIYTG
jgi:hypothetical protein